MSQVRFGVFTFHLERFTLQRNGYDIRLQNQPAQLLAYLIRNRPALVTREELREAIWPSDTFVEFDAGLNSAMGRLRRALGDSASSPIYIETVPKQGYRFVAPVEVLEAEAQAEPEPPFETEPEPPPPPGERRRIPFAAVALVVSALAIALTVGMWTLRKPPSSDSSASGNSAVIRYAIELPRDQRPVTVAISPSGDEVAYTAEGQSARRVYRRTLDRSEPRAVPGSEGANSPFYSPDGSELAWFGETSIHILSMAGAKRELPSAGPFPRANGVWAPDGYIYFNSIRDGVPGVFRIHTTQPNAKSETVLLSVPSNRGHEIRLAPFWLESGLLHSVNNGPISRHSDFYSFATRTNRRIVQRGFGPRVLDSGHLLYYQQGSLYASPLRASGTLELAGSAIEVVRNVAANGWNGAAADVSRTGTLAYLPLAETPLRKILWMATDGRVEPIPVPPASYEQAEVSPDGERIAVVRRDSPTSVSLSVLRLADNSWQPLVHGSVESLRAVWAPDSKALIVSQNPPGGEFANLYRYDLTQPGKAVRLTSQPDFGQFPAAWSRAANSILFLEGIHPQSESDIHILPLGGSTPQQPRVFVASPDTERPPAVSPDGAFVVFVSGDGPLQIQDIAQTRPPRPLAGTGGASQPLWSLDGKKIYYLKQQELYEVSALGSAVPKLLIAKPFTNVPDQWTRGYSLSPSGRFLVIREVPRENAPRIEIVVNWFQELLKTVPVPGMK